MWFSSARWMLAKGHTGPSRDKLHSFAAATSGALGGFFGLSGAALELPFTTVIMLRSIGDIARSEGHDLTDAEFNMGAASLPAGMSDTRELMMLKGSWHPVSDGEATFSTLLEWLKANPTRFGMLRDDYQSILAELEHCLNCFESRGGREGDFNLCVVQ